MAVIRRVAVAGVDHWHAGIHLDALQRAGAHVVGVSSQHSDAAKAWAAQLRCRSWDDARALVEETRPDFVVGMARHAEMPALASYLIETGIPFAIEKPVGLDAAQVIPLAEAARRRGSFAAVPFVNRYSPLWDELAALRDAGRLGEIAHAHFRIVNGPPWRYERDGVPWMLDPTLSGGGCLRNLGIHAVDAFLSLVGEEVEVIGAATSSRLYRRAVEEFATAILRSAHGVIGTVEAGYTFASPTEGDYEWRVMAANATLRDRAGELLVATLDDGASRGISTPDLDSRYDAFMADCLARAGRGEPPAASIDDCARAMRVIDQAYRLAVRGG